MICVFQMVGIGSLDLVIMFNISVVVVSELGVFLIDCGYIIKYVFNDSGIGFDNILGIFISYVYGDYVFGLECVGYEYLFCLNCKVLLFIKWEIYIEFWDQMLKGLMG